MTQLSERFSDLPEYAFPRLRRLLAGRIAGGPELSMSIGEPRHPIPDMVRQIVFENAADFARYPPNDGLPELREAISNWISRRHGINIDPDTEVCSVNGSREGLFNAGIALSPERRNGRQPIFLMPNPFYQCYGASALAAGAEPMAVNTSADGGFLPDFTSVPSSELERTTLCYVCSPSNPQGAVADEKYWRDLITLAERYDFQIVADECYSEIYRTTAPVGALETARKIGANPERVLSFQSLSKRSNAPGLRSGFVAGGRASVDAIRKVRSYGGAPVPVPLQKASTALWNDEEHVVENRALYRRKLEVADDLLGDLPGYTPPEGGFFLWLETDSGEATTADLYEKTGVKVLPGSYLARAVNGVNPGERFIRIALVADESDVTRGLTHIRSVILQRGAD